jgi:hypothetical protein
MAEAASGPHLEAQPMTHAHDFPHTISRKGALRYVDRDAVLRATSLVRRGEVVSLNLPLDGPTLGRPGLTHTARMHNQTRPISGGRFNVVNDDVITIALQSHSHWDALAHWGVIEPDGTGAVYFDGVGLDDTFPAFGSKTLGIDTLGGGIVTRAVLLDMVDLLEGPDATFLRDGNNFGLAEVERALARRNLALHPGDAVIFYTGFQARLANDPDAWVFQGPKYNPIAPGLLSDSLPLWGSSKTFALVSDNPAVEPMPMGEGLLHAGAMKGLGIYLAELWALDELVAICRRENIWEFALASVPLNIKGAFGSPANAIAIL